MNKYIKAAQNKAKKIPGKMPSVGPAINPKQAIAMALSQQRRQGGHK